MLRQPNLLWTPIDYVSRPPLLEDFSVLNEKKESTRRSCEPPLSNSENNKTRNSTGRNVTATRTETYKSSAADVRLKQWLQSSQQECSRSPPLNVSPLCRCDRENPSIQQTDDCRLHGCVIDGRKSIVLVQSSSRRSSISESERSNSGSSTSRDNDKESLISDPQSQPQLKLAKNLQENHTTQTETQFNLGAWFLHTINVPERLRERVADRNRLDVHKLPIHMKEQLKRIYVY